MPLTAGAGSIGNMSGTASVATVRSIGSPSEMSSRGAVNMGVGLYGSFEPRTVVDDVQVAVHGETIWRQPPEHLAEILGRHSEMGTAAAFPASRPNLPALPAAAWLCFACSVTTVRAIWVTHPNADRLLRLGFRKIVNLSGIRPSIREGVPLILAASMNTNSGRTVSVAASRLFQHADMAAESVSTICRKLPRSPTGSTHAGWEVLDIGVAKERLDMRNLPVSGLRGATHPVMMRGRHSRSSGKNALGIICQGNHQDVCGSVGLGGGGGGGGGGDGTRGGRPLFSGLPELRGIALFFYRERAFLCLLDGSFVDGDVNI